MKINIRTILLIIAIITLIAGGVFEYLHFYMRNKYLNGDSILVEFSKIEKMTQYFWIAKAFFVIMIILLFLYFYKKKQIANDSQILD